jgi:multisubunit Na+/H+ antiporter MnhC subunit
MVTPEEFLLLDNQVFMFLIAGGVVGVAGFLVLFMLPYFVSRSIRLRGQDQATRHLGQSLAATLPAAVVASATFDSFSFATFVAVVCILIGAVGALWRIDRSAVSRPLQLGRPDDSFVAPPLTADLRNRIHLAWKSTSSPGLTRRPGSHRSH